MINKRWYLAEKIPNLRFVAPLVPLAFEHSLLFCFVIYLPFCSNVAAVLLSDRERFQLGTLSHSLNSKATGYLELSDWPAVAPDPSVRNVEVIEPVRTLPSQCTPPQRFSHPCKHNVTLFCWGLRGIIFLCYGLLSCNTWLVICKKFKQLLFLPDIKQKMQKMHYVENKWST